MQRPPDIDVALCSGRRGARMSLLDRSARREALAKMRRAHGQETVVGRPFRRISEETADVRLKPMLVKLSKAAPEHWQRCHLPDIVILRVAALLAGVGAEIAAADLVGLGRRGQ